MTVNKTMDKTMETHPHVDVSLDLLLQDLPTLRLRQSQRRAQGHDGWLASGTRVRVRLASMVAEAETTVAGDDGQCGKPEWRKAVSDIDCAGFWPSFPSFLVFLLVGNRAGVEHRLHLGSQ